MWRFRLLHAEILRRQRHIPESKALVADEDQPLPTADLTIQWRLMRGLLDWEKDEAEPAAREVQMARQVAEANHSPLMADVLHAEGNLIRDNGDLTTAMSKFKESLALAQANHDALLTALDLNDIAFTSLTAKHFDETMLESERAAEFARSIGARRELVVALGNAAWGYHNLGDFEQALSRFKEAEREAAAINHATARVNWLMDAALSSYELGRLEEARTFDEQAVQLSTTLAQDVDQLILIRTNLALVMIDQGKLTEARQQIQAVDPLSKQSQDPDTRGYLLFVRGLIAERQADSSTARADFTNALNTVQDIDLRGQAQNALARSYAQDRQVTEAERWYLAAIKSFEEKRTAIADEGARLSAFGYGNRVYRDYAEFLISTGRGDEALMVLDESRARTLEEGLQSAEKSDGSSAGAGASTAAAKTTASRINSPILFYSLGPKASHLWAINGKQAQLVELPGQARIEALVAEHQRQINRSMDLMRDAHSPAHALYQMLIAPVQGLIPAGSRVIVIPDGLLYGLNFETLIQPTADGDRYWIENAAVTVTSSIRLLTHAGAHANAPGSMRDKPLLLIGDPLAGSAEFQALPHAQSEILRIKDHFQAEQQLVKAGAEATPISYSASDPAKFSYIHFVAHGTANMAHPLDSAVVLSPAKSDRTDFKLYAHEIVQHPLKADLVTVSACYGAGLRSYAGEGLVGLAWAFLRAGAHNVVAALWQVDDASTPQLMGQFYDALGKGTPPDLALREAKLSLLHETGVYRKPYYWGTFQLYSGG